MITKLIIATQLSLSTIRLQFELLTILKTFLINMFCDALFKSLFFAFVIALKFTKS